MNLSNGFKRRCRKHKTIKILTTKWDYFRARMQSKTSSRPKIEPLKLYQVDPSDIQKNLRYEFSKLYFLRLSPVIGGEWDKAKENIGDGDLIYSVDRHFNEGKKWCETDLYKRAKECIEGSKTWIGRGEYNDMNEFKQYLNRIDRLYEKIESEGYKSQKELIGEKSAFSVPDYKAIERNEITVNIGRNGEFMMDDGWHRLSISKALKLEKVPVRIRFRHKKWQETRKKALDSDFTKFGDHPDLREVRKNN